MSDPLIDVTRLLYRRLKGRLPTGIDRVALEYVRHFAGTARAVLSYRSQTLVLPVKLSKRAFGALVDGAARPREGASGSILLNTGHYGLENPQYARRLRRRGARLVVLVHDIIPLLHPEYCRPGEKERHATRMRTAFGGSGIIVCSQDTRAKLGAYAAQAGLPGLPMLVAPLAPCLAAAPGGAPPLPGPYFVMLGTIEPRKNHRLLLELWPKLVARMGAAAPKLLVIGQRGWECENVMQMLERSAPGGQVIARPACTDAELAAALAHARALLLPSFAEGYGLPVVEALSLGVPAIVSNLAVFREFAGSVPEYLDARDERAWSEAIADYAGDASPRRAAQLERLAGWCVPAWDGYFEEVERFLARLPQ